MIKDDSMNAAETVSLWERLCFFNFWWWVGNICGINSIL